MYLIREDKITLDNAFYKPSGEYNTLGAYNALQLPNCTLYALLRSYEAIGSKVSGIARKNYGFPDAKEWLNTTEYPVINYPKAGSVVVFGGSGNHVAFIEDVLPDGNCLITQSSYTTNKNNRGVSFWSKKSLKLVKGSTISGYGTVLGFIDLSVQDIRVKEGNLKICERYHRVRQGAGLSYPDVKRGCYAPIGYYNVSETIEADGYKWAKLEDNSYIAIMEGVEYHATNKTDREKIEQAIRLLSEVLQNE